MSSKHNILVSMEEGIEAPLWLSKIEPFIQDVLESLNVSFWEVSVLFCKDDFIQKLNKEYRSMDNPTDVLSFESGEKYTDEEGTEWFTAGDIVISLDSLKKNCSDFEVSEDEELKRLLIHGILHLAGYDHSDNSPEQEMLKLQERILATFMQENCIIIPK